MFPATRERTQRRAGRLALLTLLAVTVSLAAFAVEFQERAVSHGLEELASSDPHGLVDVIVTFKSSVGPAKQALLSGAGGTSIRSLSFVDAYVAKMTAADAVRLRDITDVEYVSIDAPVRAAMDNAHDAGNRSALPRSLGVRTGLGVTVAVLDSGIGTHQDLQGKVIATRDIVRTWSGKIGTGDPHGHGTHVAGVIAGDGSSSDGLYKGMAHRASLVSVRVLDEHGAGSTSGVIKGLEWVIDNKNRYGIRIVNLSLGRPVHDSADHDPLVRAVEKAWNAGLFVVCSAGNLGANGNFTVTSPGNSAHVMTVGSMTDWNTPGVADDMISSFSSIGPTRMDHIIKPDMVAAGNRIVSLRAPNSSMDLQFPDRRVGGAYFEMSGTSVAAPMVAAAAALMLEADPTLNPASLKARLMFSADRSIHDSPFVRGAGKLDVRAALEQGVRADTALSPRVFRSDVCCTLTIEDQGEQWADAAMWGDASAWADAMVWGDDGLWGDALLWGDASRWADSLPQPD